MYVCQENHHKNNDLNIQEIEEWMKTENLEELEEMRKEFESADALLSSPSKKSGTYKLYFVKIVDK